MSETHKCQCWAYVRGYGVMPTALILQMYTLLSTAEQMGLAVVGQSQEVSSGKTMRRIGLSEALRAIRLGYANAILVCDALQLSVDRTVLLQILELLQDHHAVLICSTEDTYIRLRDMGLSQHFYQRAFALGLDVPWTEKGES